MFIRPQGKLSTEVSGCSFSAVVAWFHWATAAAAQVKIDGAGCWAGQRQLLTGTYRRSEVAGATPTL